MTNLVEPFPPDVVTFNSEEEYMRFLALGLIDENTPARVIRTYSAVAPQGVLILKQNMTISVRTSEDP